MKKLFSLLAAALLAGSMSATMYQAVKVTSVQDGHFYIIERNARALIGSDYNDALKSTDNYSKVAIQGNEEYVWKLEEDQDAAGTFRLLNIKRYEDTPSGHVYVSNANKSTKLVMGNSGSSFAFAFDGEGIATITNPSNADRFIGETASNAGTYKAYASSNLDSYGHDFTVYELQEQTGAYLAANVSTIDFGSFRLGDEIDPKVVKVLFGGLTGSVTYSGLTAPLSATGTIENDGDEITISINATATGEINQTLTISSTADGLSATVTVKATVLEAPDPNANYTLYTGDLVEGDYVIYYNGYAMNTTESSNRLSYEIVEPVNDVIEGPAENIVWHIAPADAYWTIYNAAENKYAAAKSAKNQATIVADGTLDVALWTAEKSGNGFEFINKARAAAASEQSPNNKYLRNNGTNGFACYSSSTGGALSLYKKGNGGTTALDEAAAAHKAIKRIENGQIIIIRDGKRFNAIGARIE